MTVRPPSPIEVAKALKQVRVLVDKPVYEQVLSLVAAGQQERVGRAVAGLSEEDEFLLLSLLMGTATHLAPLEQRAAVVAGKSAPDLLARFQPGFFGQHAQRRPSQHGGYRCFVEVKSTKEDQFEMSGGALQRLREFADSFGLPLVFAVRFLRFANAALWVFVEDIAHAQSAVRVNISHWLDGLRPVLWDEHSYLVLPGTYFEATFNLSATGGELRHVDHGQQTAFDVVTAKGRFPQTGSDALLASAFFEPYGLEEGSLSRDGSVTRVVYRPTNAAMSIADLVYGMNRLPRDDDGALVFDAATALRELADGHALPLVNRQLVEHLGARYCDIAAVGIMECGEPKARYARWIATGGREEAR